MIEVSDSKLSRYAIHYVGNANNDTVRLSDTIFTDMSMELEAAWTTVAFQKFEQLDEYRFTHASDIHMNEMYAYATEIFRNESEFLAQSQHIATHLHNASQHPNIKSGELFIGLFDNCTWVDRTVRVLAIMKIDEKDTFIDVKQADGVLAIQDVEGISLKRVNNTALIVDFGNDTPSVFIRTKKKDDVVYWTERFLHVNVADESYHKTTEALQACKKFITKEDFTNTEKLTYLAKTLEYFEKEESFLPTTYVEEVFEAPNEAQRDTLLTMIAPLATDISLMAVEKVQKSYKRKIKLDDHIEIHVAMRDASDVEKYIESGIDEQGRKYYKVFFDEEQ